MNEKIEIKDIWSSDISNIKSWIPEDPANVYIQLYLAIGLVGQEEADDFQIVVGTPNGMKQWADDNKIEIISDRNLLIFSSYSWGKLKDHLSKIVAQCESDSWLESIGKLQRYFYWEYEDYQME